MNKFNGFTSSETFTQVPDAFFRLLKEITDSEELKVALYALWRIEHIEGNFRALSESDFETEALGLSVKKIQHGLKQCVERNILLRAEKDAHVLYFLNSPRGRLSAEAFAQGQIKSTQNYPAHKSNAFKLYEENIGALTPLIAELLQDAEKNYPSEWFEEAFEIAVSRNVRNWKYVNAILKRWKENGKDERRDTQDSIQDAKRYTEGEFAQFFKRD